MKTASVATAKNQLSRLLRQVKRGETILITERNQPVARLEPLGSQAAAGPESVTRLHAAGILAPPARGPLDLAAFRKAARPRLKSEHSLTRAILEEREEGR